MSIFENIGGQSADQTGLGIVVQQLQQFARSGETISRTTAENVISVESFSNDVERSNLANTLNELSTVLTGARQVAGLGMEEFGVSQQRAALIAAVYGSNPAAAIARKDQLPQGSDSHTVITQTGDIGRLKVSQEAYDEAANKDMASYSVVYNMQASRQDEFGESLFPTVTVTPDKVGMSVKVHLVTVMNDIRRGITGAADNFKRINILNAARDASILKNDITDLVPVVRTESASNFVASSLLAPRTVELAGESVSTSALRVGQAISLIGISQTDTLLAAGVMDSTDAVDTDVRLENIYVTATDGTDEEVFRMNVSALPFSQFNYAVQGQARLMTLNFESKDVLFSNAVKQADGSNSVLMAGVGTYKVKLEVVMSGSIDLETSTTRVAPLGQVRVVKVLAADGTEYAPTDAAVSAVVALFNGMQVVGYDLKARRTNSNRRQRGQLLNTIEYTQTYAVPLLAPISIPRPLGQGDQTDPSDLNALIIATRIRTSNAAVTELLRAATVLESVVVSNENATNHVDVLGVGRYLVSPTFKKKNLNFSSTTVIDSVKSHERMADIQAVLVNAIRDQAYHMYRESNYKVASEAVKGGSFKPTVIVATDPVIAQYILVQGDIRTLGDGFDLKVVSTQDERVSGKIFVTFGDFSNTGAPNPLHFGNMGWKPEVTMVLPISRNGQTSKELTVQPSFLHIVNLPVLGLINVTGLQEVVADKVAIKMGNI